MDWRVFLATLGAVFFAELADKTQLVGIGMAAKSGKPFSVLFGSVCGYLVVTLISVFIGAIFARYLKPDLIRNLGALMFVVIGVLMFLKVL